MGDPYCGFELPGSPAFAAYFDWRHRMATESLAEVVRLLTPQEQDTVRQFIDYLKRRDASARSHRRSFRPPTSLSANIRTAAAPRSATRYPTV